MVRWTRRDVESALAGPRRSLNGADLRQLDLTGLVLTGVDLAYAQLSSALLPEVDLRRAILFAVKAQGACLRGADLRQANLTAADFSRSDLRDARLNGANLNGTDLTGALLSSTPDLSDAIRRTEAFETVIEAARAPSGPVTLRVGDVLRINLEEPGTTGYTWALYESAAVLDLVEDGPRQLSSAVGAVNRRVFRFRARQAGRGTLVLDLRRSWDPQQRADQVSFDVAVEPI